MEEELKDIQLIEAYLEGKLSLSEKSLFESRISSDNDFKQLYDETLLLIEGINLKNREDLLSQLKQKEDQISDNVVAFRPAEKKSKKLAIFSIAAIGLLLVSSLFIFKLINQKGLSNQLAAYTEPLPKQLLYNNVRGEQDAAHAIIKSAAQLYGDEKYSEASEQLAILIYEKGDTTTIAQQFYTSSLLQHSTLNCSEVEQDFMRLENKLTSVNRKSLALLDLAIWQMQCKKVVEAKKNLQYVLHTSNQPDVKQRASELLSLIQ